ncbi:hypothetical protein I4F81_004767 [Pyropia yezoensis]|uniref:Uncharacterized protein n=1 Tax=Pyropia yezoensis TaxID=2788 RepID=A0ACC3BWC2_PYRYE|nr:hypothetical protein I4F81_004767 [Neopyropia yezoensis]
MTAVIRHPARRAVAALLGATLLAAAAAPPAAAAGFLPVYVDFGGATPASPYGLPGAAGLVWAARPTWTWGPPPPAAAVTGAAAVGAPAAVFATHLSAPVDALTLTIPVVAAEADRQLRLRLLFAEVYAGTAAVGARTFDVAARGGGADAEAAAAWAAPTVTWTPVDVFAAVGANAAYAVDLNVTLPGGDPGGVHLRLRRGTQNVMLSGLALTLPEPGGGGMSAVPHIWYYEPDAGPAGTWTRGALIPEAVRRGAGGVVVSADATRLYLVAGNRGGHGVGSTSSARTDMLDLTTGAWTRLADAPHARDHVHAVLVGDQIVVAGGRNGGLADFWNANLLQVDVLRTSDGAWRTLPRGGLAIARGGAVVGSLPGSGRLVLAGGEGGGQVWGQTEVLDVGNERWVTAPGGGMAVARHGSQAVACGGGLWVAGGSGAQGGAPELTSLEVWTPDGQGVPAGACVPY